jgi:diaminopimelate decarboxylase
MLYNAFHGIEHVNAVNRPTVVCDVVGPLCESSDTLGKERMLARPEVGDLMAVRDTGAYAAVMASNYNRRLLAPEVLVDGSTWRVIRRRQTIDDLLALET